jgi:hypothetical protein
MLPHIDKGNISQEKITIINIDVLKVNAANVTQQPLLDIKKDKY